MCRIGVFYDGSYFTYAQRHFYHERELGWLDFRAFHSLLEEHIRRKEQNFTSHRVVYAGWYQGLFHVTQASEQQLKTDRQLYHDLMHAGIEPKYIPMSQSGSEKGADVALAIDAMQVGLEEHIDVAVLVSGDGDHVPLVRALMKQGIRVMATYFKYESKDGKPSFINERLRLACNYSLDVTGLAAKKDTESEFRGLFRK